MKEDQQIYACNFSCPGTNNLENLFVWYTDSERRGPVREGEWQGASEKAEG